MWYSSDLPAVCPSDSQVPSEALELRSRFSKELLSLSLTHTQEIKTKKKGFFFKFQIPLREDFVCCIFYCYYINLHLTSWFI